MARVNKSSPWVVYYREVQAMFKEDPEVHVLFDEENMLLTIYVEDNTKADALNYILPTEKEFGNVKLKIGVVPANTSLASKARRRVYSLTEDNVYPMAFRGNSAFCYTQTINIGAANRIRYVVFRKEVVQYYSDNLGDINGLTSTLYQEIAKDIFVNTDGVYFCTNDFSNVSAIRRGRYGYEEYCDNCEA